MKTQYVEVLEYKDETDSVGQIRRTVKSRNGIEMAIFIYTQTNVSDIRYNDVELIGLTKENWITDANEIDVNGKVYYIKKVIPSKRYNQIFMVAR